MISVSSLGALPPLFFFSFSHLVEAIVMDSPAIAHLLFLSLLSPVPVLKYFTASFTCPTHVLSSFFAVLVPAFSLVAFFALV